MKLNRTRNAKKNLIWGAIDKSVSIITPFITRTLIIYILGSRYLGLNSLFSSVLNILNLAELGLNSAIVFAMYKPIAADDDKTICALLKLYRAFYIRVGIAVLVIGTALTPFLPYMIKDKEGIGIHSIYVFFFVYLLDSVIGYLFFSYRVSLLEAYQHIDSLCKGRLLLNSIQLILQVMILIHLKSYLMYLGVIPLVTLAKNYIYFSLTLRMYPQYTCSGEIDPDVKKSIYKRIKGLLVYRICSISRNSFDYIIVSLYLGLTKTAIYSNYFYVYSALAMLTDIISDALKAGVGNSMELESIEKNHNDMKKVDALYMALCGVVATCMLCLYQPFMRVWMGEKNMEVISVPIMLTVYFYISRMGVVRALYSDAAGLWWENRQRTVMEAVTNIVLNCILIRLMGIQGVILSSIVSLFFLGFIPAGRVLYRFYYAKLSVRTYYLYHLKYFSIALIVSTIVFSICSFLISTPLMELILRGVACLLVTPLLYYLVYRKIDDFRSARKWLGIRGVLGRKD